MVRSGPTYHSLMDRGTWTSRSRSALRQWAITLSAAFVVLLSVGTALGAMTEADVPGWAEGLVYGYGLLSLAAGVWCVRLIHTRGRDIRRSTLLLGVLQTALPVGPVMGFALPRFIRTQSEREAATASALYGASLILVLWRDMLGQTTGTSMVRTFAGGEADQAVTVGPLSLITVYLLTLLIPIGIGLYQRSKERLAGAEEELAATGQTAADMSTRLSRKEEREMIAREIHDRIGHRLSLVALYAGGLEMTGEDAEVNGRLRQVRRSAQEAIDDLQDLIRIMRDPTSGEFVPESHSLADLAEVIESVLGAGHQVSSTVMIDDPASAPELLTSAALHRPRAADELDQARPGLPGQGQGRRRPRGGAVDHRRQRHRTRCRGELTRGWARRRPGARRGPGRVDGGRPRRGRIQGSGLDAMGVGHRPLIASLHDGRAADQGPRGR